MSTIRERNGKFQAIVRLKKDGAVVHNESRTFDSHALADRWAELREKHLATHGAPHRKLQTSTLAQLVVNYGKALGEVKPLRRGMQHELDFLAASSFANKPLAQLTSEHFTRFARDRLSPKTGPTTILHNLSTLRSILNSAKPMFGLDVNGDMVAEAISALRRTGHVRKSEVRERRPTQDELTRLGVEFQRIAAHPGTVVPMCTFIQLAVHLPRRREELCKMRWEDWNSKTHVLLLRDTKDPNQLRNERIPVPQEAATIIDSLPVIDECIFPYKPESVSASFQRACNRLGIEDLHLHDLRHEGISRLFERGVPLQEVALVSGHQSWNMLRRYTNLRPEDVVKRINVSPQKIS